MEACITAAGASVAAMDAALQTADPSLVAAEVGSVAWNFEAEAGLSVGLSEVEAMVVLA